MPKIFDTVIRHRIRDRIVWHGLFSNVFFVHTNSFSDWFIYFVTIFILESLVSLFRIEKKSYNCTSREINKSDGNAVDACLFYLNRKSVINLSSIVLEITMEHQNRKIFHPIINAKFSLNYWIKIKWINSWKFTH